MATRSPLDEGPDTRPAMERVAADPLARRRFLKIVGGAGAASALALFLAACGDDDDDSTDAGTGTNGGGMEQMDSPRPPADMFGEGDLGIVNYALTLEYIEADFYEKVLASGVFNGTMFAESAGTLRTFGNQESAHVDALRMVAQGLGDPAPKPTTDFSAVIDMGADAVAGLAANVENLGAAAYLGQAPNIQNPDILASALAIHTVEARHAAALNRLVGNGLQGGPGADAEGAPPEKYFGILPDGPFAVPAPPSEVLELVTPFIGG